MISGFFFSSSLRLSFKDFVYKKGMQLLLPCFVWGVILVVVGIFKAGGVLNWTDTIKTLFNPMKMPFWFLKELFASYLLAYIFMKLTKREWLAIILSILFTLMIPGWGFQKFLLPMFWAGVLLKKNYQSIVTDRANMTLVLSALIFAACLIFWESDYTIYRSRFPMLFDYKTLSFGVAGFDVVLFRLLTGLSGAFFFFLLFHKIYRHNRFFSLLTIIGTYTLGIYIVQAFVLETWLGSLSMLDFTWLNIWVYDFVITPVISSAVIVVSIWIVKLTNKNRYISTILFGTSYSG